MSSSRKKWLLAGVAVLTIVALVFYYRYSKVIIVETVPAQRGDLVITVTPTETGTVDTDATAQLKAEIAARVVEVPVQEGKAVKAGDVLLRLDAGEVQARVNLAASGLAAAQSRLDSARIALPMEKARTAASLAEAQARFADAKQKHDKKKRLFESRLIASGEMESSEAEFSAAQAALNVAEANLEQVALQEQQVKVAEADVKQQVAQLRVAELNLGLSSVRAPMSGTVMELPVKVGELVQPGMIVARITRLEGLYVKAQVDEVDLGRLNIGQSAEITFDTVPNKKFVAHLFEISPGVSVEKLKSRNVTIKLKIAEPPCMDAQVSPEAGCRKRPPLFLRPGMSADVEIIVETLKNVLHVPTQAIMTKDKEQFVYVIDAGKVAKRVIETGRSNWDSTEIRKGVNENDVVITSLDQEGLKSGIRAQQK